MKFSILLTALCATSLVSTLHSQDTAAPFLRGAEVASESHLTLERRRGRGGGRGGGGGGKGGDGSSGGKGGSSGGKPASSYSFSPTSNAGGRTISGSGLKPAYPGGRYVGGATVPYTAGGRSPSRDVSPYLISGAALRPYDIWPRPWLYGIYFYSYPIHYNHTYANGNTIPATITCLCQEYQVCGCDPSYNATFVSGIINNGTNEPVNSSTVLYVTFPNGTEAAYINGSLPNGTTAGGGTDPSNASQISGGARIVGVYGGYVVMAAAVVAAVMI